MVALKAQANAANVTEVMQADSEKCCRFEMCHSFLTMEGVYLGNEHGKQ